MIRSYKYIISDQSKLHEFILAFFERIEFETGVFDDSFFEPDFLPIVKRHPGIIRKPCREIFEITKTWGQPDRSLFCQHIKESNKIENICSGAIIPLDETQLPATIKDNLKKLFISLYEDILKKCDEFIKRYGSLKDHFNKFKQSPNDFVLCIACGILPAKTEHDKHRDQYDHYLSKDIYPLSAVNFQNLVPICSECNSILVKGTKDVLKETIGKLFYPFDDNHKGITISFKIAKDNISTDDIDWQINYHNTDNKNDEINSWKYIFNTEERHLGYMKGRIKQWYGNYWEMLNDNDFKSLIEAERKLYYFKNLEKRETRFLDYIEKPALDCFLRESTLAQASIEASLYGLPDRVK